MDGNNQASIIKWQFENVCQHSVTVHIDTDISSYDKELPPGSSTTQCSSGDGCHQFRGYSLPGCNAEPSEKRPPAEGSAGRPSVDEAAAARARVKIEFEHAERIDTREAWQEFLKKNPEGVEAAWARKRVKELAATNSDSPSQPKTENLRITAVATWSNGVRKNLSILIAGDELIFLGPTSERCGLNAQRKNNFGPSLSMGWTSRTGLCSFSRTRDGADGCARKFGRVEELALCRDDGAMDAAGADLGARLQACGDRLEEAGAARRFE
jgi:hypothetical protein